MRRTHMPAASAEVATAPGVASAVLGQRIRRRQADQRAESRCVQKNFGCDSTERNKVRHIPPSFPPGQKTRGLRDMRAAPILVHWTLPGATKLQWAPPAFAQPPSRIKRNGAGETPALQGKGKRTVAPAQPERSPLTRPRARARVLLFAVIASEHCDKGSLLDSHLRARP